MSWEVFTTTNVKFIAITGFRMQAHITRGKIYANSQGAFDGAVATAVARMTNEAVGSSGLIFDPTQADVLAYLSRNLRILMDSMRFSGGSIPNATTLAGNPEAVSSAMQALAQVAFIASDGSFTQLYP